MLSINLSLRFLIAFCCGICGLCYGVTVDRSNEGLVSVPAGIDPTVTELDLSMNDIVNLNDLPTFANLLNLNLRNNELTQIDTFPAFPALRVLNLKTNKLTVFPNLSSSAGTLTTLDVEYNDFVSIPAERLMNFVNLEILNLGHCHVTAAMIPEVLLPSLKLFDLRSNDLQTCPDFSKISPKAEQLLLSHNDIHTCDKEAFKGLDSLHTLTFLWNELSMIPDLDFVSDSLAFLDLSRNPIAEMSAKDINKLRNLTEVYLDYTDITVYPHPLQFPPQLTEIRIPPLTCDDPTLKFINWMRANMANVNIEIFPSSAMVGCFENDDARKEFVQYDNQIPFEQFSLRRSGHVTIRRSETLDLADVSFSQLPGYGEEFPVMSEMECYRTCSRTPTCLLCGVKQESGGLICLLTDGRLAQPIANFAGLDKIFL